MGECAGGGAVNTPQAGDKIGGGLVGLCAWMTAGGWEIVRWVGREIILRRGSERCELVRDA